MVGLKARRREERIVGLDVRETGGVVAMANLNRWFALLLLSVFAFNLRELMMLLVDETWNTRFA